ncbi:hypothetical protein [Geobacter argillaceus]|uniref:Putative secreted protein with PEP-CTERM sorting signal n=1 Tax=Geobacter argillaceus TaxID=345631 RepID=A0A562WQH1_9BACT|nr:hypothetical protein [Geobacter argillaceus]TWJ32475.1 putative secreted protein with PEP-CTERM sorting signal [Geobacter argillaceus]
MEPGVVIGVIAGIVGAFFIVRWLEKPWSGLKLLFAWLLLAAFGLSCVSAFVAGRLVLQMFGMEKSPLIWLAPLGVALLFVFTLVRLYPGRKSDS